MCRGDQRLLGFLISVKFGIFSINFHVLATVLTSIFLVRSFWYRQAFAGIALGYLLYIFQNNFSHGMRKPFSYGFGHMAVKGGVGGGFMTD